MVGCDVGEYEGENVVALEDELLGVFEGENEGEYEGPEDEFEGEYMGAVEVEFVGALDCEYEGLMGEYEGVHVAFMIMVLDGNAEGSI